MKLIALLACAVVALALPACTTAKKKECSTAGSCCAKSSTKHKH